MHTDFLRGRSGGLVFTSLEEFSTAYFDQHSQRLGSKLGLGLGLVNKAVNKAEVDVFWNSLAFSVIQQMLAILSLVPLPGLRKRHLREEGKKGMGMDYPLGLPGHLNHCGQ